MTFILLKAFAIMCFFFHKVSWCFKTKEVKVTNFKISMLSYPVDKLQLDSVIILSSIIVLHFYFLTMLKIQLSST